ncbi:nitroreductase family protein [uncultured Desulfovibrio sp.]|uniref:nitroreductase family protein n=1 Tax=uncultured Desulfovibrio sp. TaxID=167968 RepID=UPI002623555A|nr:nitroreductase family protein [uncultured Desulfovibrio sp.]
MNSGYAWRFRRACKKFDPKRKISGADFHAILEGGRLSPRSFGFEPWQFLIFRHVVAVMVRTPAKLRHDSPASGKPSCARPSI